jgi:hypothetical protein
MCPRPCGEQVATTSSNSTLPFAHGGLVEPDKHRNVRCPHGGSHQQDGLPCLGDTLLGARKPHDRFDRFYGGTTFLLDDRNRILFKLEKEDVRKLPEKLASLD